MHRVLLTGMELWVVLGMMVSVVVVLRGRVVRGVEAMVGVLVL